jgi:hypothetical protein
MPAEPQPLSVLGLAGYVEEVAAALGLSAAGIGYEVTDTATGYIALATRSPTAPHRDLMLTWTDTDGWVLAVEPTRPGEDPEALARLRGQLLPAPGLVARFVGLALSGELLDAVTNYPIGTASALVDRLAEYEHHDTAL